MGSTSSSGRAEKREEKRDEGERMRVRGTRMRGRRVKMLYPLSNTIFGNP